MNNFFHHLTHLPPIPASYLEYAQTGTKYLTPAEHKSFTNLTVSPYPKSLPVVPFNKTKLFKDLKNKFRHTDSTSFVRVNPQSLYDWHTDHNGITTGINILLTPTADSYTLFRTPTDIPNNYHIVRCDYQQFVPTLFNSEISHCVINLSNEYRYLLRIPIRNTPYEEVRQFLMEYNLENYHD
jgi:hypothetical protein